MINGAACLCCDLGAVATARRPRGEPVLLCSVVGLYLKRKIVEASPRLIRIGPPRRYMSKLSRKLARSLGHRIGRLLSFSQATLICEAILETKGFGSGSDVRSSGE